MDWRALMQVTEWERPKRPSWTFFKISRHHTTRGDFYLFTYHPSWSLTWGRFLVLRKQGGGNQKAGLRFSKWGKTNGQWHLRLFWLLELSYHWQPLMRWPAAPACKICGDRIDAGSQTWCGSARVGCAMPEPEDKRAVFAKWKSDRATQLAER